MIFVILLSIIAYKKTTDSNKISTKETRYQSIDNQTYLS